MFSTVWRCVKLWVTVRRCRSYRSSSALPPLPLRMSTSFGQRLKASWIPLFGITYSVGVDGLSLALVVLTTTLTWISLLASFEPIQTRVKEY